MDYMIPNIQIADSSRGAVLTQYQEASFNLTTAVTGCDGTSSDCEGGTGATGVIIFLCLAGFPEGVESFGNVIASADVPCQDNSTDTIHLAFSACSVATESLQALCPSGSVAAHCAESFECSEVQICETQGGGAGEPNSISIQTPDGSTHACTNLLDAIG